MKRKLSAIVLAAALLGVGAAVAVGPAASAVPVRTAAPVLGTYPKVTGTKVSDTQVSIQWTNPTGYVGNLDKWVVKQDGAVVYEGLANSYVATVGYNTVTTFTVTYHLSLDGQTTNLGVGYKYTNGAPPAPAAPDPASLAQISIPTPTLVSRTENSLTVAWGQPSYTGVLQPGFTIRAFDPSGRSVAATSTNGRTATLGGLQPGVLYAVNVYADVVSQDGRKRVTGLSVLCVNTVAAPPAPVPAAPAPAVAPATAPATAPAAPATSTTAATSASASRAVTIAPTRAEDAQATASRLHPALAYLAQQEAAAPASAVQAVTSSTSLLDPGVLYFAGLQESTQPAAGTWIPLLNPGLAYFLQP